MNQWRLFAELANREGWFWETDDEHRFVWLSDSFEQITGMEAAWQIGKSRPRLIAGTISQDELDGHLRALANREPFDDFVFKRAGPQGAKWFSASAVPIHDDEGNFTGYRGIGRDVTDQHERLERVSRLEGAMEEIDDIVAIWGKDDRLIYSNRAFKNANSDLAEMIDQGGTFQQILWKGIELGLFSEAKDDPEGWFDERLRQHRDPGRPVDIKHHDGSVRELRMQRVASGATLHIGVDVTEQRKLMEEIRSANDRFSDFADVSKDWLWEQDADLRFTYMSHGNDEEFEFDGSAFIGMTRREVNLSGVIEARWAEHDEILTRREPLADFRIERRDASGKRRIISTSGRPFFHSDGEFAGYRGTGRDITEWVGLIETLERKEIWLRQVLDFASVGVVMVSKDGKYEYANEVWLGMSGYTREEISNVEPASTYVDPGERAWIVESVKRDGQVRDREITMKTKHGQSLPVSLSLQKAPSGDGGLIGWVSDISQRKAAEKELINSQIRFRDFAESSSDWFWEQDADLRFSYISEKRNDPGADPYGVIGKTRREAAPDGVTAEQWVEHDEILKRREPLVDFRIERTRPGREREIIFINGRPLYDENGNFAGYRGTGRDVTEQAGMIDALEQNEAHLRQMLDTAPIGVVVIDTDGKIEYVNDRYKEILKVRSEDIIGETPDKFYADPEKHTELLDRVIREGEVPDQDVQAKASDGATVPLLVSMQQSPNGDGRVIGWSIDMTGPREAERKLLEFQQRLQDFAEASSDSLWETNAEHEFTHFSEAKESNPNFHREDLIGKNRRDLIQERLHLTPHMLEHLDDLDARRPFRNFRFSNQRPGGPLTWTSVSGRPFFDRGGHFLGCRGVGENITEQVALESKLRDALDEAQAANMAKSGFLSSMSHELRTPLNSILGFSQLLTMDTERPLSTEQSEGVGQILKAGNHLLELINQVLDLSRIEQGHLSVTTEDIDPGEILEDCLALISHQARARGLKIENSGLKNHALPTVRADRVRTKQVLLNLLVNAVKYNTTGTRIGIHQALASNGSLRVEVWDDGPGIPENREEDIFKPFNRLGMEALEIEGTGIGLTISKELVELMNGTIGFHRPVEGGAMFWFELPVADGATNATDLDRALPLNLAIRKPQPHRKVLYIEDNPANLMLVQRAVEQLSGMEFLSAHTAELGIVMVRAQHPDLVLMDIDLPGMSGIDAMRVLRTSKETANIPVVAISAVALPHDLKPMDLDGFDQFLTKPLDISKLLDLIDVTVRSASKQLT